MKKKFILIDCDPVSVLITKFMLRKENVELISFSSIAEMKKEHLRGEDIACICVDVMTESISNRVYDLFSELANAKLPAVPIAVTTPFLHSNIGTVPDIVLGIFQKPFDPRALLHRDQSNITGEEITSAA